VEKVSDGLGKAGESSWGLLFKRHFFQKMGITLHHPTAAHSGTLIGHTSTYPPLHSPYGYNGISLLFYKHDRVTIRTGENQSPGNSARGLLRSWMEY